MELALAALLRLIWIAGTLPIVVASVPLSCLRGFHSVIMEMAKRGKTTPSSHPRFTVPHIYFSHFYILGVCWTTCLLLSTWFYVGTKTETNARIDSTGQLWKTVFVLILMETQVIRRLYESLFVFKSDSSARMHVLGYLVGLFFYAAEPVSLCWSFALEALIYTGTKISEFAVKGWQGNPETEFDVWDYMKPLTNVGWFQWIGAVIFFWGWIHQFHCHKILGSLRKQRRPDEYIIPHGDWFEIVSCAHYLAEIVMYLGILLATGGSDATVWLLLAFVMANLIFAAAETHQWYLQKFDNYPRTRRAIIPLVY